MNTPDSFELTCLALGAVATLCSLVALRAHRLRHWREVLSQPAKRLNETHPKWARRLLPPVRFEANLTLFELLFQRLQNPPDPESPVLLPREPVDSKAVALTADQQVERLMSLTHPPIEAETAPMSADALTKNVLTHLVSVLKGRKKVRLGVEHALLDSLAAGGGFAGAKLGSILALAVAPLLTGLTALAIPMIMITGAWLGTQAGKELGGRVKTRHTSAARKRMILTARDLKRSFLKGFPSHLRHLDAEFEGRAEIVRVLRCKQQLFVTRALLPGLMTVFYDLSLQRLHRDWKQKRDLWKQFGRRAWLMRPLELAEALQRLDDKVFEPQSELRRNLLAYKAAQRELHEAEILVA